MADITVTSIDPRKFHVQIREENLETSHHVTVPESLINELQLPEDGLDRVVRESFVFLLERERASSIMKIIQKSVEMSDRPLGVSQQKATVLTKEYESSSQRILASGRTVALPSYYRPHDVADAGTREPGP